jgi:phage replication initiation protein
VIQHKLTKAEKLVLEGQCVKATLAEAQVSSEHRCSIDWVSTTVTAENLQKSLFWTLANQDHDAAFVSDVQMAVVLGRKLAQILGFQVGDLRPGRNHYDTSLRIDNDQGVEMASVSAGGVWQKDTVLLMINGSGCTFAKRGWQRRLYEFLTPMKAKLSRIDLALDFFDGGFGGVAGVREACLNGGFDYNGRRPDGRMEGLWDAGRSRTFYIGSRGSKQSCAYEKAHQFGNFDDSWWRFEQRFWSQDRVLPLEMLISPDKFFAGSHPYCQQLLDVSEPVRIKCTKRVQDTTADAVVARKIRWIEKTVAPSLVHLTRAFGGKLDDFAWIGDLVKKHSDREVPRSLRAVPGTFLTQGILRALEPAAPASVAF